MRYYIGEGHPDAPDDRPWAVCSDDGPVEFVGTREEAVARLSVLTAEQVAALGDDEAAVTEIAWESNPAIGFQDVETADSRIFHEVGARTLPLPFLTQFQTAWGHDGAYITGRIDTLQIEGTEIRATGVFLPAIAERAGEAAELCRSGAMPGVSVDFGNPERYEFEVIAIDDDGWPTEWLEHYYGCPVMGATQVAFPAFPDAAIAIVGADIPAEPAPAEASNDEGTQAAVPVETSAAAGGMPSGRAPAAPARAATSKLTAGAKIPRPPRALLTEPVFTELTRLTVTEHGDWHQVAGHFASRDPIARDGDQCHIGWQGMCMTAPRSASAYSYFRLGSVVCDDGSRVATGPLVMHLDHEDVDPFTMTDWRDAQRYYDNTGLAIADGITGDDEFGPWFSGVIRPGARAEDIYALQASSLSGDWREIAGRLELIALQACNTPGFPLPRVLAASGRTVALRTGLRGRGASAHGSCGCGGADALASITSRMERLERDTGPARHAALLARIRG